MNQTNTMTSTNSGNWPLVLAFIRLPLVLAGSVLAILAYEISGNPVGAAAGLGWSTLIVSVVNLICLGLLRWRARVENLDLRRRIGFERRRLLPDIGWGLLWSILLGGMLLAGVFFVMFVIHGRETFNSFETAFVGDANFSFSLPTWIAIVSAVVFPTLNAPVEEVHYRGYAQPGLAAAWQNPLAAVVVTAIGFGLQHIVFAVTVTGALAYALGFFFWGLGAGFIARRQGRLLPLIVAHFISNLSFGIIPLLMLLAS